MNSFYLPSVLQSTRQELIQSDSSTEANEGRKQSKRKLHEIEKEYNEKKPEAKCSDVKYSFPLPALKSEKTVHTSRLLSFKYLWAELEDSEMQDDIFRRRIYNDITIIGNSRSVKINRPDVG